MPKLTIRDLTKQFGNVRAVDGVSFDVADGEFVTLLGPSGCGKSTTLFSIAGLDRPTGGKIMLDERTFFDSTSRIFVPAEMRNCGLVFQSYALWPHMTVRENVAFPLKIRRVPSKSINEHVEHVLGLVEMEKYAQRYPHELSGGQQQRVALARTLVYRPNLLLLDEPLSNLDAKLRLRARGWLKQLQMQLGLTTIFVTHDQSEALSLSDRIVIMDGGRIKQIGTPQDVYRNPATPFIADFIGGSNFLTCTVTEAIGDAVRVSLPDGQSLQLAGGRDLVPGRQITVSIRPESVHLVLATGANAPQANVLRGHIVQQEYLGARYQYALSIADRLLRFEAVENLGNVDAAVTLSAESCTVFPFSEAA